MSPIIQTEADKLISLVDTKGKISAKEASKILGLKERQVEEWADFLEKHGIIKLKLNFFNLKLISKGEGEKEVVSASKSDKNV